MKVGSATERSPYLDVEGAAKFLLVKTSTIYRWVHEAKKTRIPVRRHGRKLVFLPDELKKWSDERSNVAA